MTRLTVTADAERDTGYILSYLARKAGHEIAERYANQFRATIECLLHWPENGALRPQLGEAVRIAVVSPNVLIYEYSRSGDTLTLLRILHGRRNITDRLLRR